MGDSEGAAGGAAELSVFRGGKIGVARKHQAVLWGSVGWVVLRTCRAHGPGGAGDAAQRCGKTPAAQAGAAGGISCVRVARGAECCAHWGGPRRQGVQGRHRVLGWSRGRVRGWEWKGQQHNWTRAAEPGRASEGAGQPQASPAGQGWGRGCWRQERGERLGGRWCCSRGWAVARAPRPQQGSRQGCQQVMADGG